MGVKNGMTAERGTLFPEAATTMGERGRAIFFLSYPTYLFPRFLRPMLFLLPTPTNNTLFLLPEKTKSATL
jgi:hypothetical protein